VMRREGVNSACSSAHRVMFGQYIVNRVREQTSLSGISDSCFHRLKSTQADPSLCYQERIFIIVPKGGALRRRSLEIANRDTHHQCCPAATAEEDRACHDRPQQHCACS
jgi:hypothetical protein